MVHCTAADSNAARQALNDLRRATYIAGLGVVTTTLCNRTCLCNMLLTKYSQSYLLALMTNHHFVTQTNYSYSVNRSTFDKYYFAKHEQIIHPTVWSEHKINSIFSITLLFTHQNQFCLDCHHYSNL